MSSTTTSNPPLYGQVVVGPPGSGKTTYCNGMQQYLRLLGRDAWVINLDPANEDYEEYETILDVGEELVNLKQVMEKLKLGPNGGLLYCMEYVQEHVDVLVKRIQERSNEMTYLLLDFPGQVELFTHGTSVQKLLQVLVKRLDLRLCAVNLIDSTFCVDATKFLAAALVSTTTMLRLELPSINVLSKADLLEGQELPLGIEYFTECNDLSRLLPFLDEPPKHDEEDGIFDDPDYQRIRQRVRQSAFYRKHEKLHKVLAEVVEDFGLLSYMPLDISNSESVARVLAKVDKCNGYVFTGQAEQQDLFNCAIQTDTSQYETIADIQERLASETTHGDEDEEIKSEHSLYHVT